jgi:hypothetical protein
VAVIAIGDVEAELVGAPWAFAERVLGERPLLLERQPIRPIPGGRSFASGCMPAPFHTDSQCALGVPPALQLMLCVRPARSGGQNLYLDTWPLVARIEREDPAVFARLFDEVRRLPFVFGDLVGPTLGLRGGHLVFSHTAAPRVGDRLAPRLAEWLEKAPVIAIAAQAGDLVVIHNHRLLHGRSGFDDPARSFVRLLVWSRTPWPAPPALVARARAAQARLHARLAGAPGWVRARVGLEPEPAALDRQRLDVVLELLRGTPAGVLSRREQVPEPELYRWRDAVLRGGLCALAGAGPENEQELDRQLGS